MAKKIWNLIMKDILIGVVTFNPNLQRLQENLDNIYYQNTDIVVYDNDSDNFNDIEALVKNNYPRIRLKKNNANRGLGVAYNWFFHLAEKECYQWVMLLDQDSVCDEKLVEQYRKHLNDDPSVAMYTCLIVDRNSTNSKSTNDVSDFDGAYLDVSRCISSASIMRTSVFSEGCEYEDDFFIDKLDFDICLKILEHNYKIRLLNYKGLIQEIGQSQDHKLFGHTVTVYNHSAFRRYYMARNDVLLARRHKNRSLIKSIGKETFDIICVLIYEKDKKRKFNAYLSGMLDGLTMRKKS